MKRLYQSFRSRGGHGSTLTGNHTTGDRPTTDDSPNKTGESARAPEWERDEQLVAAGKCHFQVKYLGAKEVSESRGMQLCDDAFNQLLNRYKSHKGSLFRKNKDKVRRAIFNVSGDGLRVIDESSKALIVDQTIEKVSFCAPTRVNNRGFTYICRDGTTKRWMCHVFLAKENGERLSHAVGCAFTRCLEEKKKREEMTGNVEATFNKDKTVFQKSGSFHVSNADPNTSNKASERIAFGVIKNAIPEDEPLGEEALPETAIERKHAPLSAVQRMSSMKHFSRLNSQQLPFKRNLSLKLQSEMTASQSGKNGMKSDLEELAGLQSSVTVPCNMAGILSSPPEQQSSSPMTNSQQNGDPRVNSANHSLSNSISMPAFSSQSYQNQPRVSAATTPVDPFRNLSNQNLVSTPSPSAAAAAGKLSSTNPFNDQSPTTNHVMATSGINSFSPNSQFSSNQFQTPPFAPTQGSAAAYHSSVHYHNNSQFSAGSAGPHSSNPFHDSFSPSAPHNFISSHHTLHT